VPPLRYIFDSTHSCVWVNARSNLHPINTETRGLEGYVELTLDAAGHPDLSVPVAGTLTLLANRLSSGNHLYDLELKRRIDARTYPTIEGRIVSVTPGDGPGRCLVTGDLTFHGRTRTFAHDMVISSPEPGSIQLQGEYVFDLREFNMKPPSMLMVKVYPQIAVRVNLNGRVAP
jgi:polyisoprenoid-binding protein YceI